MHTEGKRAGADTERWVEEKDLEPGAEDGAKGSRFVCSDHPAQHRHRGEDGKVTENQGVRNSAGASPAKMSWQCHCPQLKEPQQHKGSREICNPKLDHLEPDRNFCREREQKVKSPESGNTW